MFVELHTERMQLCAILYAEYVEFSHEMFSRSKSFQNNNPSLFEFENTKNVLLGLQSTRVCAFMKMKCCNKATQKFMHQLIVQRCLCLPDCTLIDYDVENSQSQFYHSRSIADIYNNGGQILDSIQQCSHRGP